MGEGINIDVALTMTDLLISDPKPFVRLLTIHRPEVRNALSNDVLDRIATALEAARDDDAVRAVVLTGGEKFFAAGADLRELSQRNPVTGLTDSRPRHWERIRKFPKPLIAAVNGFALGGGCELSLHCDIIIAGAGARFGQPEVNLGIIPGAGGTQRLTRIAGQQIAMKLCLSGEIIDAAEANAVGLVAEVVPDDQTLPRAIALAETIASRAPVAVRLAKEAVLNALDLPLEAGLQFERKAFSVVLATQDFKEGTSAFLEKRKAKFEGR
jgi:enoyl-CoA hydratase